MSRRAKTFTGLSLVVGGVFLLTIFWSRSLTVNDQTIAAEFDPQTLYRFVGDGVTDDTKAIQNWINNAEEPIRLPKGVYRITKPLIINLELTGPMSIHGDGVASILMDGPGPAIQIVGTHFKSADPGGFEERVWKNQRMPLIDGLAIVGKHKEANGIEAIGTMQLTLSRLHIRKCRHAVHLVKNNRNVIISDCHIYENSGVGVFYDNVNLHQSNVVGSHISYCGGGGIVSKAGNVRNIHISGCDLESNMSPDQPPTANVLIDCRGSNYGTAEVAITGCTIQHNHQAADSANVRIIGNSDPTEKLERIREGHVTITGNVFSDVFCNVHLKECRGVTMTGNTFWMGFDHNLLAENCSNLVIGPNAFDRNPRYDYGDSTTSKNSLVFRNCEDSTITGLHISGVRDRAALTFDRCRRMNISNCTILDCDNVGLWLKDLAHSRVSGCFIRDDREGASSLKMTIEGSVDNVIQK